MALHMKGTLAMSHSSDSKPAGAVQFRIPRGAQAFQTRAWGHLPAPGRFSSQPQPALRKTGLANAYAESYTSRYSASGSELALALDYSGPMSASLFDRELQPESWVTNTSHRPVANNPMIG